MNSKVIVYSSLAIVAACAIGYMIYIGTQEKAIVLTNNFATDDQLVYDLMRNDLVAYVNKVHGAYGGWFDDIITQEYNNGANVSGRKSKAAALLAAVNNTGHYPAKRKYYTSLVNNLKARYK